MIQKSIKDTLKETIRSVIQETDEDDYPKITAAEHKYGAERVDQYLRALLKWNTEGSFSDENKESHEDLAKILRDGKDILKFLNPRPQSTTWLYRGMLNLKRVPKSKQKVQYSPKRPITSWSESSRIATGYCQAHRQAGLKGIVLEVAANKLFAAGDVFLWPYKEGTDIYEYLMDAGAVITNREWAVYLQNTVQIQRFAVCS